MTSHNEYDDDPDRGTGRYDAALGRRLPGALGREAGRVEPEPGAWARFEQNYSPVGAQHPDQPGPENGVIPIGVDERSAPTSVNAEQPGERRSRGWRVPLLAAAAVVAIAMATSAVVTGGFGGDNSATPAAGAAGSTSAASEHTGNVDTAQSTANAAGTAVSVNSTAPATTLPSSPILADVPEVPAGPTASTLSPEQTTNTSGGGTPPQDGPQSNGSSSGSQGAEGVGDGDTSAAWCTSPRTLNSEKTIDSDAGTMWIAEATGRDGLCSRFGDHGDAVFTPAGSGALPIARITDVRVVTTPGSHTQRKGRLVWGEVGDSVATVTASGGTDAGSVGANTAHGPGPGDGIVTLVRPGSDTRASLDNRLFMFQVPALGEITVKAKDSGGEVLATTTLDWPSKMIALPANDPGGPFVAMYPDDPDGNYHDALLEGTITVVDGCVRIAGNGHDGKTYTPIFPASQVKSAKAPAVVHFHGQDYAEGDSISVGGSSTNGHRFDLPERCGSLAWLVSPVTK